jgi:hypothetical protein
VNPDLPTVDVGRVDRDLSTVGLDELFDDEPAGSDAAGLFSSWAVARCIG